jgi:hypothetical protein
MATLQIINTLLKDIQKNIALLIEQEAELNSQIELLSHENNKLRTHLKPEQLSPPEAVVLELPPYNPLQQQPPLSSIVNISNYVIDRNETLLSNREELSKLYRLLTIMVPKISIKEYIMKCKTDGIQDCYDSIDKELETILQKKDKLNEQKTNFQKSYLLYDLIRQNTKEEFIVLLKNIKKIYNIVIHEPQQLGGAKSTLLQVIGLTKIKAIIQYMNIVNGTKWDISTVTNANNLIDKDDIINTIAQFFYDKPIMLL